MKATKISIDTEGNGLESILKPYQAEAMKLLWEGGDYSSRDVWQKVNERMTTMISRASVINFLNAMVEDGVLDYVETTGKGGYRRIYTASKTEQKFWVWLIQVVNEKLKEASGLHNW